MNLTFTTGLMGAGKSAALIEKFMKDTRRCIAFSAHLTKETGSLGKIESRNGQTLYSINLNVERFEEVIKEITNMFNVTDIEAVYIDEVQFFPIDMISRICSLAEEKNMEVNFYGLLTTFTGSYFESSSFLLKKIEPELITNLPIDCQHEDCDDPANYNARIVNGHVMRSGETFVAAKSKYLALCEKHYFS